MLFLYGTLAFQFSVVDTGICRVCNHQNILILQHMPGRELNHFVQFQLTLDMVDNGVFLLLRLILKIIKYIQYRARYEVDCRVLFTLLRLLGRPYTFLTVKRPENRVQTECVHERTAGSQQICSIAYATNYFIDEMLVPYGMIQFLMVFFQRL